jgi:hypothetical protein
VEVAHHDEVAVEEGVVNELGAVEGLDGEVGEEAVGLAPIT